jgi:hypothetical protein
MKHVYIPKDPEEKAMQRALIQYRNPKNYELVYKALKTAGREDLIGFGEKCLIKPPRGNAGRKDSTARNKPRATSHEPRARKHR